MPPVFLNKDKLQAPGFKSIIYYKIIIHTHAVNGYHGCNDYGRYLNKKILNGVFVGLKIEESTSNFSILSLTFIELLQMFLISKLNMPRSNQARA